MAKWYVLIATFKSSTLFSVETFLREAIAFGMNDVYFFPQLLTFCSVFYRIFDDEACSSAFTGPDREHSFSTPRCR